MNAPGFSVMDEPESASIAYRIAVVASSPPEPQLRWE
jgi:hypothetical protein